MLPKGLVLWCVPAPLAGYGTGYKLWVGSLSVAAIGRKDA